MSDYDELERGDYYAIELTEMLHDLEMPNPLPWAVYQKRIFLDGWIADCVSFRKAKILVEALTEENNRTNETGERKSFKKRIEEKGFKRRGCFK